jgi:polysaccharide biosynthesis/export protein
MTTTIRFILMSVVLAVGAVHAQPARTQTPQAAPVHPQQQGAPSDRRDYNLGPGDAIRIAVYQNPDLTLETRISESGFISYPLLGRVQLAGLRVDQAEKAIADGLLKGNFIKNPQVTVIVLQVRGNQASVLGQVNRPGRYPLEAAGLRLSDVIAIAGGISAAGSDVVTLTGSRNGRPFRQELDLPLLFSAQSTADNPVIQDGDVIYVDRVPTVYIYGEVQRPGAFRLERDMSVMQALAVGGGLTQRGTEKGLRVHRRGPDGKVAVMQPSMDDKVRNGDVIYVRESLF